MINPVWLRTFCTLVEVGHFTRTAEQLYMTESGVSEHISKLEEHLGQPLLIREGKLFTLTTSGNRISKEAQVLIQSLEELESQVGLDATHEGVVKLASPGSVGLKLYPYLLLMQTRFPKLIIDYQVAPNNDIERMVADHKIDIGLMTRTSMLSELSVNSIAEEPLLLVTPSTIEDPSWEQLLALGFIGHPDGAYQSGKLLSVNYPEFQHCNQFKVSGFTNQTHLILESVSLGLGFTVLPNYVVSAFKSPEKIKVHALIQKVTETIYIGTHNNRVAPNRVKTVITEVTDYLQSN